MKIPQILMLVVCTSVSALHAQVPADKPTLPPGPLLNRAPEFFQWIVTFKTSVPKAPAGPAPQADPGDSRTTVTKTKSTYHMQSVNGVGARTEKWIFGGAQISILPNAEAPILSTQDNENTFYSDYGKKDFFGFDWISKNNFSEIKRIQGTDYLIFRDKVIATPGYISPEGEKVAPEMVDAEAVINATTRLPVVLRVGESLATYEYGPPPSAVLVLPKELLSLVTKNQDMVRRAAIIPPP